MSVGLPSNEHSTTSSLVDSGEWYDCLENGDTADQQVPASSTSRLERGSTSSSTLKAIDDETAEERLTKEVVRVAKLALKTVTNEFHRDGDHLNYVFNTDQTETCSMCDKTFSCNGVIYRGVYLAPCVIHPIEEHNRFEVMTLKEMCKAFGIDE